MARNRTETQENTVDENVETVEGTETETAKPARISRSPRERAQLKLDQASKRLEKATQRRAKYVDTLTALDRDIADAQAEVDFRKSSSHLTADAPVADETVDA